MLRLSSATYRKQGKRPSHIDRKLQTLLLRCQGLIYLRMFKLKEPEHKKAQRQISDFKNQVRGRLERGTDAERGGMSDGEGAAGRMSYIVTRDGRGLPRRLVTVTALLLLI